MDFAFEIIVWDIYQGQVKLGIYLFARYAVVYFIFSAI